MTNTKGFERVPTIKGFTRIHYGVSGGNVDARFALPDLAWLGNFCDRSGLCWLGRPDSERSEAAQKSNGNSFGLEAGMGH